MKKRGEMKRKNASVSLPPGIFYFSRFFHVAPWLTESLQEAFTLANQKGLRKSHQPIKARAIACSWTEARGNFCVRITIGSDFTSDWTKK